MLSEIRSKQNRLNLNIEVQPIIMKMKLFKSFKLLKSCKSFLNFIASPLFYPKHH